MTKVEILGFVISSLIMSAWGLAEVLLDLHCVVSFKVAH